MPAANPIKIAFVASEVAPLSKTGGLGDVSGALPRQLHALGHDVRIFTPLHSSMHSSLERSRLSLEPLPHIDDVSIELGAHTYRFSTLRANLPDSGVPIYLIDCPAAFDRPTLYTASGDEHLRYLLLQFAALESCQRLRFAPQILQCNDWHTALVPLLLKTLYAWDKLFANTRTLLSIHNIGYQGLFSANTIADARLQDFVSRFDPYDVARGGVNWLKEGIRHAHRVATVSPTYAQEICAPLGGHGLDGALRARGDRIVGILNGVDYHEWDPRSDALLPARYSSTDLSGKRKVREALIKRTQLHIGATTPLIGSVSRLTQQKGFDLLFDTLPELLQQREFGLCVLGSGETRYQQFFASMAQRFPDRVAFTQGYSEELAHWIEAGSDMFLMPSMYEPCGLNQMYSLRYGTVPIVRRTGGLADSVPMWDAQTKTGAGVVFNDYDAQAIRWAMHTALDLFKDRAAWMRMIENGMALDYSWERQAVEYVALYEEMLR